MSRTLNELIATAVLGGEEVENNSPASAETYTQPPLEVTEVPNDVEKIAAALEFMGRRGVSALLEKTSMCKVCGKSGAKHAKKCPHCGMKKKASAPENNMGQMHAPMTQSQVGPHKDAPPMAEPPFGLLPNNMGSKPGLPAPANGVDTAGAQLGTHHAALSSNEAAIAYTKKEKAKQVIPALGQVLDHKPYSDGKLKENLRSTEGDKNIKKAHALNQIQAELARRDAGGTL